MAQLKADPKSGKIFVIEMIYQLAEFLLVKLLI